MPKAERRALILLATVVALGISTRFWRSYHPLPPPPSSQGSAAVTRQLGVVDSIRGAGGRRSSPGRHPKVPERHPKVPERHPKVDLDSATAEQMRTLLGIGPTLAARIVADRTAHGRFGCLAELRTVKGVGPALLRRIDSLVTFSGLPRPTSGRCGGLR